MDPNSFERSFSVQPLPPAEDGQESKIIIDWLGWGDYIVVGSSEDEGEPSSWNAFFRLVKVDGDLTNDHIDFDGLLSCDLANGESNFRIDPAMIEPRLAYPGIPVPLIMRRGVNDYLSAIEINGFQARNSQDAILQAMAFFNIINAHFAFSYAVPLKYSAASVRRADGTMTFKHRVYYPWPEIALVPHSLEGPAGLMARLMLSYADGVLSNSYAYRFICFFKIVDHIVTRTNSLRRFCKEQHPAATWIELNGVLPADLVGNYDLALVGRSYVEARNRYRDSGLRNSAAHIVENELAYEPLDPDHAAHYRAGASICRFIAHHLIRLLTLNCQQLLAQGASVEQLSALIYPHFNR